MIHNVLLIQFDPAKAAPILKALALSTESEFHVEWVRSSDEGLAHIASRAHPRDNLQGDLSAIVVDLGPPGGGGIETFERLFKQSPHIPILVVGSAQDEETAKLAVLLGAYDYLLADRVDAYTLTAIVIRIIARAASVEALFEEKERAQVTLDSIGDAVVSTDVLGNVIYLNAVAERMTGWTRLEAAGHPVSEVIQIIDATSHEPAQNPILAAMRDDTPVALTPNCMLRRRDGTEIAIEDSAAPIHNRSGRVIGAVMVFHDVSVTRALSLKMAHLAQHDSLTGLPNRRLFSDRLTQAIALAQRHRRLLAVLYVDIDLFKKINDSLGHAMGDRLLQSVAQRIVTCVRGSDTVSRQGGDEFALLLPEVPDAQDAAATADKILLELAKPYVIDDHEIFTTASIGIAMYPSDGSDAEALMQSADFAMYHAKESGRNRCQFFTSDMNVRAIEWRAVEGAMRNALAQQEFVLQYQPTMDLETGKVIGTEALVRWRHPQRGLLAPSQFIPVAEIGGSIVAIGRWVLLEACQRAKSWQDAGLPPVLLAVNISAVELRAKDFAATVREALALSGLDPRYLELELTETFLMQDTQATATALRSLKEIGVRLSLDDFGTGYSSLSYLKKFPIDTLKIDRSFVCDLVTDADDASIVSAVISMGKSLHMQVIAEGIETEEQVAFLQERRCPAGQGYYFSAPLAADDFAMLLAKGRVGSRVAKGSGHRSTRACTTH